MPGLNTFVFKTGSGSLNMMLNLVIAIIFYYFSISISFNSETKDIIVASHNFHGFKTTSAYHNSCISKYGGIWFGQEHWLSEKQLPLMQKLNGQSFARSGMEDAVSSGVLRGRPFGGVSITWSHDLNHVLTPLTKFKHKRVVAVELETTDKNIIFISVYMPFLDSRNRETCRTEAFETLSMIDTIIEENPHHLFVIGGDLNCELTGESPFDSLWCNFITKNRLSYCRNLFASPGFTYHHESLGQKKFNDHFIVSNEIYNDGCCSNHEIMEDGDNPSDHLPIKMSMRV